MKKAINPIAAMVQPLAGRKLQSEWQQNLENVGGSYDRRNWNEMFNAPQWSAKTNSATIENTIQTARLNK